MRTLFNRTVVLLPARGDRRRHGSPDLTRREFVHLAETGNGRAAYVLSKEAFRWNDCLALAFSS
jgi:hypothetical protein